MVQHRIVGDNEQVSVTAEQISGLMRNFLAQHSRDPVEHHRAEIIFLIARQAFRKL